MIPLLRLVASVALVFTPAIVHKGNNFFQQQSITVIEETRKCFACNLSGVIYKQLI
jgi:hypothetical protein